MQRAAILTFLFVSAPLATGCDLIESAKSTTVVAGILAASPELMLPGQFSVDSETIATAFVGERESATSSEEPEPIKGANVNITFAGNVVKLNEQDDPAGFYEASSVEDEKLIYASGQVYSFGAKLAGSDTKEFGGSVTAPTQLTEASLTLMPQPTPVPMVPNVYTHPKSGDLKVAWQAANGRYAYVTVVRGDPMNPDKPEVVFDNRPKTGGEIIKFIVGTPPTSIDIPGATFSRDGAYAVIVVTMDKGMPQTNTFLGSPILAGSGAAVVLAVGNFQP
jgi:hypothetical protein